MEKENIQSCKRCNETYVVVSTYYKHGDYDLNIFYSENELRDFLIDEYISYELCDKECEENEESCICQYDDTMDLETLIKIVCDAGEEHVNEERGYGVREVQKIKNTKMEKENTQSCKKCNKVYIVVSTYYNYGEWDFNIFDSELELKIFINNEYSKYELCSQDRLYKLNTFKTEQEVKEFLFDEKIKYESYNDVIDIIDVCSDMCGNGCLDGCRDKCNKKCILCSYLDIITFKQIVLNEENTENCNPKFFGLLKCKK